MSLQTVLINNKNIAGTVLFSYWLHSLYNHRSIAILQQMIDKGYITGPGLPCKLARLPGRCPICDAAGLTKIPRGSVLKDTTALPLGVLFHMDFCFFNIVSIRGFTAALIIVERTSRYIWFFPTRSKHAPIDLCYYFFNQMQRLGYPCIRARTDEDGALINNTEFCAMMYKYLGMTMESTGGYESSIKGAAESPIKTIKRGIRADLIGSSMGDEFWCFAGQLTSTVYNQVMHRMTQKIPAKELTGKVIPIKKLHPFGARVKVLHHLPAQRSLSARTSGDLRILRQNELRPTIQPTSTDYDSDAIAIHDTTQPSSFNGRFMGYSNHEGIILVYVKEPMTEPRE
jgi:hypothetical protein